MVNKHKTKETSKITSHIRPGKYSWKINWNAIKMDYLSSEMTVDDTLKKYSIRWNGSVAKKVKGWGPEREELQKKAMDKLKEKTVNKYVQEWEKEYKLFEAVDSLAAKVMMKHKEDIEAKELANVVRSIFTSLQGKRLIKNQSTENVANKNYHVDVVKMMKEMEDDDGIAGETTEGRRQGEI